MVLTAPAALLIDAIRAHARLRPMSPALLAPDGNGWTFATLETAVDAVAARVRGAGIASADTVALALPDGADLALSVLGVGSCAVCAPLHPAWQPAEFERAFDALKPRALVVAAGSTTAAAATAHRRGISVLELQRCVPNQAPVLDGPGTMESGRGEVAAPDAVLLVLQTSGTSGLPAFVRLTHRNVAAASLAIADTLELEANDRALSVMPLAHIHGLSAIFASLMSGGSVVCAPDFSAPAFFGWLAASRPTWYTAAPTIHQTVLDEARVRHADGGSLHFIRSASAPLPRELAEALERVLRVPVIEAYGMTEASPQIASNRRPPHARKPGSVGKPAGPEVAILGGDGVSVAPGATGEIAIRGDNVCTEGWLRTGDLGYVDGDGDLFLTGRQSDVINRGGEKIAPLEIESVLLGHPDVVDAVTFAVPHRTLGEGVAAAVVLRNGADVSDLAIRAFVAERLAPFKVPHPILRVPEVPTGATGKRQRRLLAAHFGLTPTSRPSGATRAVSPLEATVAGVLGEVLGRDPLDRHTNFFVAGGDSLSATHAILRLRDACAVDLALDTLFTRPTVAELAECIAGRPSDRRPTPIPVRRPGAVCPLSSGQQRLWLLDQLDPGAPVYNMQLARRLSGPLNLAALEQAVGSVRERHEILRTTFPVVAGRPVQHIVPPSPMRLPVVDLQAVPQAAREHELRRVAGDAGATAFNLARGPLFQALVVRLDPDDHVLLLTMHHIVSDGWSMRVLQGELRALYAAAVAGQPWPLPPLSVQFADVAAWERGRMDEPWAEAQRAYWMATLAGLRTSLDLASDRARPATATARGARVDTTLPRTVVDGLRSLGRRHDATLFMTVLAAFQALLMRYSGQEDLAVGTPCAGRGHADTEPLIGFFANTVVMRGNLSGDPSFVEHLHRTRSASLGAFANQDLPFEEVVDTLHPSRQPGRTPLFQVMFAFQNLPGAPTDLAPGLRMEPLAVEAATARFDLTLYVNEEAGALHLGWQYNADLFDPDTISGMAASFDALAAHVVEDADCPVSALPLDRPATPPSSPVHPAHEPQSTLFPDLFREHVSRTPDAVAVSDGHRTLTYAGLHACAERMAIELRRLGVSPGAMVGVCVTRSVASAVAVLGIWRAGGVYVPFDPDYPAERLARMAADADIELLVVDAEARACWPGAATPVVDIDHVLALDAVLPALEASAIVPTEPAYVIYTSGSAGTPKAVAISHGNVAHYLGAMRAALGIVATDRYLHTASFAFSSSMRQLLLPLASGAAAIVASREAGREPRALLDLLRDERVTVLDIVPSYWRALNRWLASMLPAERAALLENNLRLLLSASEPLLAETPRTWRGFGHRARLLNMYGQTETTGIVSLHEIADDDGAAAANVPVGRSLPGVRLHVRDSAGRPVPDGVVGELVVEGRTVGLGYRNRPDESARRFFLDPISGEWVYATGDRARRRADGSIVLLGRVDRQVKLRGFRIEPGDVEAALATHPLVHDSAVVVQSDEAGHERLVAYVVAHNELGHAAAGGADSLSASLQAYLRTRLPHYLVPAHVVVLDALPLTPTGKLDRAALRTAAPAPATASNQPATERAEPQRPAEQLLSELWSRLLGRTGIDLDDNFFDLGGDSLLGLQMIEEANRAGLRLTPAQLFRFQTVRELACASGAGGFSPAPGGTATGLVASTRSDDVRVSVDSARAFGIEALTRAGLDAEAASLLTEVQIEASLRGQPTHNLGAIPRYARRVRSGVINATPRMRIEHDTPTSALLDADHAAGQLAALKAMDLAVEKAVRSGVGIVGVRRSNHFGAAGHYVWRAAAHGVIGLCTTNSALWLAPTGGLTPLFGTNPLGVGVPAGRHHPIVLDVSMSVTAKGKVALELAEGRTLTPGWILDRTGRTSIDPADLIAGLGVPIGGHKGYGLALTMEILAGVLTGAGFGSDHRRERLKQPGAQPDFGHFFIAIDPGVFMPPREFAGRVDRLIDEIKHARRMDGIDEILLPGEFEMRAREQNLRRGLPLSASVQRTLEAFRAEAGLVTPLMTVEALADA